MFKEILREYLELKSITQTELSEKLGDSQQAISDFLSNTSKPRKSTMKKYFDFIEGFENYYKENTRKYNIVKTIHKIEEPIGNNYKPEGKLIIEDAYPEKEVYVIPIKGRGGLENAMFDELMFKELKKETLTIKTPSSNGSKWFKIEVEGISMDDGSKRSLSEGDWAYCRSISKQYWKSKFHNHKYDIFCFFHNERGIIFKKIKHQDIETGVLVLESLHPNKKEFPDFNIKVSECSYICNVIKVLSEF